VTTICCSQSKLIRESFFQRTPGAPLSVLNIRTKKKKSVFYGNSDFPCSNGIKNKIMKRLKEMNFVFSSA